MFKSVLTAIAVAFVATTSFASASDQRADMELMYKSGDRSVRYEPLTHTVVISGPTTSKQSIALYNVLKNKTVATIVMYGPGGDFYAGLRMGEMIANANVTVVIPEGKSCISACSFMAIAGKRIILDGTLEFHAPYFSSVPVGVTILDIAQRFGVGYIDMATYLVKHGYTTNFARKLLKDTSPCKFIIVDKQKGIDDLSTGKDSTSSRSFYYTIKDNCAVQRAMNGG
jgi:hypothetical protein